MKLLRILLVLFLILGFSVNYAGATSQVPGEYSIDPSANNPLSGAMGNIHYSTNDYVDQILCQKFTTSKSVIADYLYANIGGTSTEGVQMKIRSNVGGSPGPGSISIFNPPAAFGNPGHSVLSRFTTSGFTQVTPGTFYWLCISAPAGNDVWWYAQQPGGYDNGFLQHGIGGSEGNQDFGFQIWTSNMQDPVVPKDDTPVVPATPSTPTTPQATSTPAASTPLPAGVSLGSGAAPIAPTAAIKAPSNLTVVDLPEDQGGSLKLDWTATTSTDITGYKVFRSTTEVTKDFKEIVKTEKSIVTFTDNTAAIGTKYYYMVRAYKTTQESASSNIANGTSVDNLAPAIPKGLKMVASGTTGIDFSWEANTEADLGGYLLSVVSSDDDATVIDSVEIGKADTTYKLAFAERTKLTSGTDYLYYLQAKDANSNISEKIIFPAEAASEAAPAATTTNESSNDWMLIALIAVFAIVGGSTIFLAIKFKKEGKPVPVKLIAGLSALLIIIAGLTVYRLIGDSSSGTKATTTEDKSAVVAPKHADWPVYQAKKYPYKFYYPVEYKVTEGAGGDVSINKGADIIGEIYSVDNSGDDAGMLTASGNLYKDDTKGYMTGAVESSTTAVGVSAQRFTGTFGKNAGAKVMVHDGIKGSVVQFTKNGRTWEVFSYDNADPGAIAIFDDMIADMSF